MATMVRSNMQRKVTFVGLLVAISILAGGGRCDAKSLFDQLPLQPPIESYSNVYDLIKDFERQKLAELPVDRVIDYAVELGCKELNGMIALSRVNTDRNNALGSLEILEDIRTKKATPKHTPRFGRK